LKIIIAGGGTAGHINPGIAIAKFLKQKIKNVEIVFIGTRRGLETKLVSYEGFDIEFIRVRGFKRQLSFDTILGMKELLYGMLQARKIIKKNKPNIVIGTGGYVCGPVVFVATQMNIPTLIHEQNVYPGITNKILSRFVDCVAISFNESQKFFKNAKKIIVTGNPIRNEILEANKDFSRKEIGFKNNDPIVVIFGGSRGAKKINDTVSEMIKTFHQEKKINIIFATGEMNYQMVVNNIENITNIETENIRVIPYIYEMSKTLAAADLVVSRAGAITLSEITALGIPSILIPSPNVTANHQEHNARALEKFGGAIVILEKELESENLYNQITNLLFDKNLLKEMAINSKKMGIKNGAERIYHLVLNILGKL